ncbi:hypothetical protein [Streptomyces sp. NPDC029674]|uniref:hypothetical protein n=1 Tax=Streptomyces sp. NPDC029674 TaxID=3365297 RepID=UPI00384F0ECB
MHVLCAYLRLPYTAETDLPPDDMAARHAYLALREVRHTVIRLIRDRTAVGPEETHVSWRGHDFDFTGVVFDGGDFSGAAFTDGTVHFVDVVFADGRVDFSGTRFSGGTVDYTAAGVLHQRHGLLLQRALLRRPRRRRWSPGSTRPR